MTNTQNTQTKARCYVEACCNEATHELHDYGQGESGPFNPAAPVYEWRGVRGYCRQHSPDHADTCSDCGGVGGHHYNTCP